MIKRPVVGSVRRGDVNPRKDKRIFTKTADVSHYVNKLQAPLRGGTRL